MKNTVIGYRPEIDGLRAFAILLVVLFHAFPKAVPGGYIGVDIFFVISGYLITKILVRDFDKNKFTYTQFYARRFRRILPALILMFAALWLVGFSTFLVTQFESLGKHIMGGAGFYANLVLWSESGYFDTDAIQKPLLHLWSLAVEEQFYIVWPVLLTIALRLKANLTAMIALLFAASFAFSVWSSTHHASLSFYWLPSRFWQLLVGCGMAVYEERGKPLALPPALAIIGLIASTAFAVGSKYITTYPGLWALIPTLSAAALIGSQRDSWLNKKILSKNVPIQVGLISYPLYLWHWPFLSVPAVLLGGPVTNDGIKTLLIVAAYIVSYLTYRYVELPFQNKAFRSSSFQMVAAGALVLTAAFIVGFSTSKDALISPAQARMLPLTTYSNYQDDEHIQHCFLEGEQTMFPKDCLATSTSKRNVALWGDSFAAHLYPGYRPLESSNVILLTASNCPPLQGLYKRTRPHCQAINNWTLAHLVEAKPDEVILEANWSVDYESPDFEKDLRDSIVTLTNAGIKSITVLGQLPYWNENLYEILEREYLGPAKPIPLRLNAHVEPHVRDSEQKIRKAIAGLPVKFIPLNDFFCDADGCLTKIDDSLTVFDRGHLTKHAAEVTVQEINRRSYSRSP